MNALRLNELSTGMSVIDNEGIKGTVAYCEDEHNVSVIYPNNGAGIYCIDPDCPEYDPLYSV